MAEASKAFSTETLNVLRQKIESFTKNYDFNQIETEDYKGSEVIIKLFN